MPLFLKALRVHGTVLALMSSVKGLYGLAAGTRIQPLRCSAHSGTTCYIVGLYFGLRA